jgi:predicted site-specific integrase-resolvase
VDSQTCTLHEAAETLDLHYMTIYRYVRTGMLLASKKNGTWVIEIKELEKLKNKAPAAVGRGNRDLFN